MERTYLSSSSVIKNDGNVQTEFIDKTFDAASTILYFQRNIDLVVSACTKADPELCNYIFESVTEGVTYDYLKMIRNIPCGRSKFYNAYRLFFWHLDKMKL